MDNCLIDICLATFNGAEYLEDLIKSVQSQTMQNWNLLISDDGSDDGTQDIVQLFCAQDGRIKPVLEDDCFHNATQHFLEILKQSNSPYSMFCDQDDIWLPDKIEASFDAIRSLEQRCGSECPLLVFTDSKVVDKNLKVISESNVSSLAFDPKTISISELLVTNVVQGCTILMNRAARELVNSYSIPVSFKYHDHWVAAVVAATGHIYYLDRATLLYRQHQSNVVGADTGDTCFAVAFHAFSKLFDVDSYKKMFLDESRFIRRAEDLLSLNLPFRSDQESYLKQLSSFYSLSLSDSLALIKRLGLLKNTSVYGKFCQLVGIFGSRWFK